MKTCVLLGVESSSDQEKVTLALDSVVRIVLGLTLDGIEDGIEVEPLPGRRVKEVEEDVDIHGVILLPRRSLRLCPSWQLDSQSGRLTAERADRLEAARDVWSPSSKWGVRGPRPPA